MVAACAAIALSAGCEGRSRRGAEPEVEPAPAIGEPGPAGSAALEIDLSGGLPEEVHGTIFGPALRRSHLDLVRTLRAAAEGDKPKGLFVRFGTATLGLAVADEIGGLLGGLRDQGVPIVCHADEYGNGSFLLASRGCSSIWLSPAGEVGTIGLSVQLLFGKSLLDRLHVGVDFLQVGKYKGAEEPFTRDAPSPEARETLVGALRGMRGAWLDGIARGRKSPKAAELVEDGPFTPNDAKAQGLIDSIGYLDEARDEAKKRAGVDRIVARFGGEGGPQPASRGLVGILRALEGSGHGGAPHVAVVAAIGSIAMSSSPSILGGGEGISDRDLGRVIVKLTSDTSVKAVVLRIDSPGGSALASDLLWKKLMKLREKKPVVVSVGGMAASGGYYLACTGTKIVAEPTSLLGSIGVVGGKLAFGDTLEQIGAHAETISAAPDPKHAARASYMSPFTPWDSATRDKVLRSMTSVYDLFLQRIAEGRGSTVAAIAPSAEGRVFGGAEAKERGLVDQLGGFGDALDLAMKLASLPADTPFEILGDAPGLFDLLDGGDPLASGQERAAATAEARRAAREALLGSLGDALGEAPPEAATFVSAFSPLLHGEHALAVMPFAAIIR
ncbi:MAG: S49 family peptidase [Byssovorax sp.]